MTRGKAVSDEIRKVIHHLHLKGQNASQIAESVNKSRYTVRNIIKLYKSTGSVVPKPRTGSHPHYSNRNLRALKGIIKQNRRASYNELKILWNQATGKNLSRATCHRAARKLGYKTYKVSLIIFVLCSLLNRYFIGKREAFTDNDSEEK